MRKLSRNDHPFWTLTVVVLALYRIPGRHVEEFDRMCKLNQCASARQAVNVAHVGGAADDRRVIAVRTAVHENLLSAELCPQTEFPDMPRSRNSRD
jgi:hypothetical protein